MAAGIGLRDTSKATEETFKEAWKEGKEYFLFECIDDKGDAQGCAVGQVKSRYQADKDGAFIKLQYVGVQDPYYAHWVESVGASDRFHHVCRKDLYACMRKVGRDVIVHVQRWAFITEKEMEACLKEWKVKKISEIPPGRSKALTPVTSAAEEARRPTTAAKAKSARPGSSPPPPDEFRRRSERGEGRSHRRREQGEKVSTADSRDDDSGRRDDDVGRSNAPSRKRRRSPSPSDGLVELGKARGTVGQAARTSRSRLLGKTTPLDVMLDEDILDEGKKETDARFEELRKSLDGKKKRKEEHRAGATAVLAERVRQGSERKQKKKKTEKEKVAKFLRVLKDKKSHSDSTSGSDGDEDEDDDLKIGEKGDLSSRQRKLRKMSTERPGCLLIRGYRLMHDQLGTLFGDVGASGSNEEILQPAALRYLLSSALPLMDVRQIGEERLRELRTLATGLDLLVSGRVSSAGDLYVQRFKSILMGIRDGSTAASRFLELIPQELYATASTLEESDFARTLAIRQAKSEELLAKASSVG